MPGFVHQLNISNGGVPKLRVESARVTELGLEGDRHRDTANHGGYERALCLYAFENIEAMRAEGHPIEPGTTGENITVRGLDWPAIVPGTRLRIGNTVEIEITGYTTPCKNIQPSFADGDFNRLNAKLDNTNSRVYARVLSTGTISTGDPIVLMNPVPETSSS